MSSPSPGTAPAGTSRPRIARARLRPAAVLALAFVVVALFTVPISGCGGIGGWRCAACPNADRAAYRSLTRDVLRAAGVTAEGSAGRAPVTVKGDPDSFCRCPLASAQGALPDPPLEARDRLIRAGQRLGFRVKARYEETSGGGVYVATLRRDDVGLVVEVDTGASGPSSVRVVVEAV